MHPLSITFTTSVIPLNCHNDTSTCTLLLLKRKIKCTYEARISQFIRENKTSGAKWQSLLLLSFLSLDLSFLFLSGKKEVTTYRDGYLSHNGHVVLKLFWLLWNH